MKLLTPDYTVQLSVSQSEINVRCCPVFKIKLSNTSYKAILFRNPRKVVNYNIRLKLGGKPLYLTSSIKYLGILLDEHLTWKTQINSLSLKLSRANGILSKLQHFLPPSTLTTVYYALFHSHISYATQVWGQHLPLNSRIFKLQKTALRLMTFSEYNAHSKPLFKSLGIPTISDLTFTLNTVLTYQTLNQLSPLELQNTFNFNYLPSSHVTRGLTSKLLSKPSVRTSSYGINSIRYQSLLHWNLLQSHFNSIDLTSIRMSKLKSL